MLWCDRRRRGAVVTAEDMQRFVSSYPAFRQKNNIVSKHVAIVSELARLVDRNSECPWCARGSSTRFFVVWRSSVAMSTTLSDSRCRRPHGGVGGGAGRRVP
jgi:hypothetical protein